MLYKVKGHTHLNYTQATITTAHVYDAVVNHLSTHKKRNLKHLVNREQPAKITKGTVCRWLAKLTFEERAIYFTGTITTAATHAKVMGEFYRI